MKDNMDIISKQIAENKLTTHRGSGNHKFLVFHIDDSAYGIALSRVKEVIGPTDITSVPDAQQYFKGIINLRGQIISIIDFRLKFSMPEKEYIPKKTAIIIVEQDNYTVGIVVDHVEQVANYEDSAIDTTASNKNGIGNEFISGVAKNQENNNLTLLLNIDRVINSDNIKQLHDEQTEKAEKEAQAAANAANAEKEKAAA